MIFQNNGARGEGVVLGHLKKVRVWVSLFFSIFQKFYSILVNPELRNYECLRAKPIGILEVFTKLIPALQEYD